MALYTKEGKMLSNQEGNTGQTHRPTRISKLPDQNSLYTEGLSNSLLWLSEGKHFPPQRWRRRRKEALAVRIAQSQQHDGLWTHFLCRFRMEGNIYLQVLSHLRHLWTEFANSVHGQQSALSAECLNLQRCCQFIPGGAYRQKYISIVPKKTFYDSLRLWERVNKAGTYFYLELNEEV